MSIGSSVEQLSDSKTTCLIYGDAHVWGAELVQMCNKNREKCEKIEIKGENM